MSLSLRESRSRGPAAPEVRSGPDIRPWSKIAVSIGLISATFGTADLLWLDVGQNGATHTWVAQAVVLAVSAMVMRFGVNAITLLGASVGMVLVAVSAGTETPLSMASVMLLFTFARSNSRGWALAAGGCVAATAMTAVFIASPDSTFVEAGLELLQASFFAGIGIAFRANSEKNNRLIEVEATKLAQAERLRLAREVHDVIAHNLSSIAVQSGVAARLIDEDPAHAKVALEHINEAGRTSLDELRAFLGLLRSDDYLLERSQRPIRPADINLLVQEMSTAGISVDLQARGSFPKNAGDAVLATTYHILQESLLNVARHAGPVEAIVELRHGETAVDVRVLNEPGRTNRQPVPSTGVGIVGMTERAVSVGGTLRTNVHPEGGFEVVASLPYQPPSTP